MKNILMFIGGVALGAGVSWVYHKQKFEQMMQEEVQSLREHMKEKEEKKEPTIVPNTDDLKMTKEEFDEMEKENNEQIEQAEQIINYQKYSHNDNKEDMVEKFKKPFVVTPDDFASIPGFDTDTFYYHHDDIISNDNQEIVDDVEHILGLSTDEIKEQFGVYEEDAVYIRNMRLKCDYEILREETDFVRRNGD